MKGKIMVKCDKCQDRKVIFKGKNIEQCVCVRQDHIVEKFSKKVGGELKFFHPDALKKVEDMAFIMIGLPDFKHYLAGYLLYKRSYSFEVLSVSEYFNYRMEHGDDGELLKPDLVVINFASLFFNKAAPLFVMQLCQEREIRGKKTWLISNVPKETLEIGFRESKEIFDQFLKTLPVRKFNPAKKRFGLVNSSVLDGVKSTKGSDWRTNI